MSNNNWRMGIKERGARHLWPEDMWYVVGYYEDEKTAFDSAEAAWNKRQQEGWEKSQVPGRTDDQTLQALADGSITLDIVDDYFHWNVITPHWYLHLDGTWQKMICNEFDMKVMSGQYHRLQRAEQDMLNSTPPARFEGYEEHLQNAREPYSCRATT